MSPTAKSLAAQFATMPKNTPAQLQASLAVSQELKTQQDTDSFHTTLVELKKYDEARAEGRHGLISRFQPSNPRAFIRPPIVKPRRPSDLINTALLAETIGLTDGDRRFLSNSLAEAAKQIPKGKVSTTALAKQLFESAVFADFVSGGPMPDRDEFKDRFVEALDDVLRIKHGLNEGFAPERSTYASGPRYDPKAVEDKELAIVPTTACLRCHEIAADGKVRRFDLIPPLAFDPFDKPGRDAWLKTADPKRKKDVVKRMIERLVNDADMPPEDAPEYGLFRVKGAAAFNEVKHALMEQVK